jgi:MFS transporter, SP family, general alpha glucoside:H+ symporter
MSSTHVVESKTESQHVDDTAVEAQRHISHDNNGYDLDEKAKVADYKADAVEAENAEHNMGVLDAVKAYPMATFWAFIMSFTIVSCLLPSST